MLAEPEYALSDVARHSSSDDCWVIVDGGVYDVTAFLGDHPGGVAALSKPGRAGCDVTPHFRRIGHSAHAHSILAKLRVGRVASGGDRAEAKVSEADVALDVRPHPASEESYAIAWHAKRRAAILKAHPEVARLQGTNEWTVPIGVLACIAHAYGCLLVQRWPWYWTLILAWTLGALCKMYQFAVCHDVCHGSASWWCKPDVAPRAREFLLHALTLPAWTGETHQYYAYQHIGHHSSLGKWPWDVYPKDALARQRHERSVGGGDSSGTPRASDSVALLGATDSGSDNSTANGSRPDGTGGDECATAPPVPGAEPAGVEHLASPPPLPTDLDGDIPATSTLLLLVGVHAHQALRVYRAWYVKLLVIPVYQALHMLTLTFVHASVMLLVNPVTLALAALFRVTKCTFVPLDVIVWAVHRLGMDPKRQLGPLLKRRPDWRRALTVWGHLILGVGFQAWVIFFLTLWLVTGAWSGASGVGDWGLASVFKGVLYLLLSELNLHGFAFHPYMG